MKFRTEIKPTKSKDSISFESKISLIGSCFSQNIGNKLHDSKFNSETNPFGIVYNPHSLLSSLHRIIDRNLFTDQDFFKHNDSWHCYDLHSSLSDTYLEDVINKSNEVLNTWHGRLKTSNYLIITLGTAWVFRLKVTNQIVSNCHKIPNNQFDKELLNLQNLTSDYQSFLEKIKAFNTNIKIIFTVSPIRHWKDGIPQNTISKSLLHLLCASLTEKKNVSYLPAYELVMDDLRDYRFYEKDMLHPSQQAIEYIWNFFKHTYFDTPTIKRLNEIEKIKKGLNHKPLSKKINQDYWLGLKNQIEQLPDLDFATELTYISSVLNRAQET
jgi:hypothetical protein